MVQCPHPDCSDSDKDFVSNSSMRQHHTKVHNVRLPNSECENCKSEFFRKGGGSYCENCKDERYKGSNNPNFKDKKKKTNCNNCNKSFEYYPSDKSGKICSNCWESDADKKDTEDGDVVCTYCGDLCCDDPIYNEELPYCSVSCTESNYEFDFQIENSKDKGDISESKVISYLNQKGLTVSIPFGDNARYDIIVDIEDQLLRVQVKTGYEKKDGVIKFNTNSVISKSNGTQNTEDYQGDADIFAVYYPDKDHIYWIPIREAPKTSMYLRYTIPKKKSPNINYIDKYTFERGVGRIIKSRDK